MSEGCRGGERRQHARIKNAYALTRHEKSRAHWGRVLRSVLRPAHVDPHYAPREKSLVVGRSRWHHGWANPRKREEPTLGPSRTDGVRLAACQRSRKGSILARSKGWRSRPPSLRGCESSGLVARTSVVVAEVGRRCLASNKLGKRAPKRAAGSSEQGSSCLLSSVGETSGGDLGRNDESHVDLTASASEDRRQAQGGERSPLSGRNIRKGAAVVGPGL
jgi:hypothetical protein